MSRIEWAEFVDVDGDVLWDKRGKDALRKLFEGSFATLQGGAGEQLSPSLATKVTLVSCNSCINNTSTDRTSCISSFQIYYYHDTCEVGYKRGSLASSSY